ncbi:MAG: hypothetical protein SF051_11885 [Elusimicrobiota bacterium]|nr:hypothetical protein [Elusimicrobiota bacterium]
MTITHAAHAIDAVTDALDAARYRAACQGVLATLLAAAVDWPEPLARHASRVATQAETWPGTALVTFARARDGLEDLLARAEAGEAAAFASLSGEVRAADVAIAAAAYDTALQAWPEARRGGSRP